METLTSTVCFNNTGAMGPGATCTGAQKCKYRIDSVNEGRVKLIHSSRLLGFKDTIRMSFDSSDANGNCIVHAISVSQAPYALLDGGQNRCNIENLFDESFFVYDVQVR